MNTFLILKLQGVMQAWGKHTYEDYRPSEVFPTHSGLTGLLAACLGIDRFDVEHLDKLGQSFMYAARLDKQNVPMRKLTDFHVILETRRVNGSMNPNPVISNREYLCDASFTVALQLLPESDWKVDQLEQALKQPVFTPVLGRRSCPIIAPLYGGVVEAEDALSALKQISPHEGIIYSAWKGGSTHCLAVRDFPRYQQRQFDTRSVYIHNLSEAEHAFQSV